MAKLVFSNNTEIFNKIKSTFTAGGYEESHSNRAGSNSISVHARPELHLEDGVFSEGEDFVYGIGTFLTIEPQGDKLKYIYQRFEFDIPGIRALLFGNYCIVVKKGSRLAIFTDDLGMQKMYFYNSGGHFALTNRLFPLASAVGNVKIHTMNLLELAFQNAVFANGTMFEDIIELGGNQSVEISLPDNQIEIKSHPLNIPPIINGKLLDEVALGLSELLRKYAGLLSDNFERITISMTGGLDSRLVLASFLSVGAKPVLVYGKGNSPLTNTRQPDLDINQLFSERYKLKLDVMNWDDDPTIEVDEKLQPMLRRYDEYFQIYGANRNVIGNYESVAASSDFIEFGYFGEMIRNLPWLEEEPGNTLELERLLDKYLYFDISRFSAYGKDFRSHMRTKVGNILREVTESQTDVAITKDEFQRFHSRYRYSADTVMANFINQFCHSAIICGIPAIQSYILSIPYHIKSDASFQLKVIDYLFPDLLEVPFFSHTEDWRFDREQFKLFPVHPAKPLKKSRLARILKKSMTAQKIYHTLRGLRSGTARERYQRARALSKQYVTKIKDLQKELDLPLIRPEKYYGDIRGLIKYYHYLYLIKQL